MLFSCLVILASAPATSARQPFDITIIIRNIYIYIYIVSYSELLLLSVLLVVLCLSCYLYLLFSICVFLLLRLQLVGLRLFSVCRCFRRLLLLSSSCLVHT